MALPSYRQERMTKLGSSLVVVAAAGAVAGAVAGDDVDQEVCSP